jgi:signal transduction histidine kinase
MRSFVHTLLNAKMIDCTFRADDSLNELKIPMEIRRNFYLIFKEAINNLVKYSNAKRASIFISHNNRSVSFIIRDDGIGFDKSLRYNGNGLKNMKKRADEIKARLEIESVVGQGTSIELNMKI